MDLNLFFEKYETDSETAIETDRLCGRCPVQLSCLKMGVETSGTGVHGGVYLSLGQVSKARNSHKSEANVEQLVKLVKSIKEQL